MIWTRKIAFGRIFRLQILHDKISDVHEIHLDKKKHVEVTTNSKNVHNNPKDVLKIRLLDICFFFQNSHVVPNTIDILEQTSSNSQHEIKYSAILNSHFIGIGGRTVRRVIKNFPAEGISII